MRAAKGVLSSVVCTGFGRFATTSGDNSLGLSSLESCFITRAYLTTLTYMEADLDRGQKMQIFE